MENEQINLGLLHLPGELVDEILCRLPVKSVLRFRCVAKSWNYTISNKKFIKTHLKKSSMNMTLVNPKFDWALNDKSYCTLKLYSPHSLFYETCETYAVEHRFDCMLNYASAYIVGYCNGLCCMICNRRSIRELILWNPSTRKSRKLPPIYENIINSPNFCGFGYDESSEDYKILTGVYNRLPRHIIRLYSLKNNSWKTIENFLSINTLIQPIGVLVNGKLHWASRVRVGVGSIKLWKIGSFDLGNETVGSIKLPSFVEKLLSYEVGPVLNPALTVLDGSLCVHYVEENVGINIWIMKEYGVKESWCRLINIRPEVAAYCGRITPLCVSREGDVLFREEDFRQEPSFIIYNLKESSFRRPKMKLRLEDHIDFYNESLVSPFPDGEGVL